MAKKMKLHVVLEERAEGGYTAYILELPGCVSEGGTEKQALENIREAKELYLEELGAMASRAISKVKVLPLVA